MSKTISKSTKQKSRLSVLVVDDNEQITKLISSFLDYSNQHKVPDDMYNYRY